MRIEDGLAWFGAIAAVGSTAVLGNDGWTGYEVAAAGAIFAAAGGLGLKVYWEPIRDFFYDGTPDEIRPAVESDAAAIFAIAKDHFGSNVTDVAQIKSLIKKDKGLFYVHEAHRDPTTSTIEGYACLFPLSSSQVDDIKERRFSLDSLSPMNIPRGRSNTAAVYIGAIVGTRLRSQAKMLGFLEQHATMLAKKSKTRTVYAKPVTAQGLRLMTKKNFAPVNGNFCGMHNFYAFQVGSVPPPRRRGASRQSTLNFR